MTHAVVSTSREVHLDLHAHSQALQKRVYFQSWWTAKILGKVIAGTHNLQKSLTYPKGQFSTHMTSITALEEIHWGGLDLDALFQTSHLQIAQRKNISSPQTPSPLSQTHGIQNTPWAKLKPHSWSLSKTRSTPLPTCLKANDHKDDYFNIYSTVVPRSSSTKQGSILPPSAQTKLFRSKNCLCSEMLQELHQRFPRCSGNPEKKLIKTMLQGKMGNREWNKRHFSIHNHHNSIRLFKIGNRDCFPCGNPKFIISYASEYK